MIFILNNDFEIVETIFYQGDEGAERIEVIVGDETLWASQKSMAQSFDVNRQAITKHLKNIFESGELDENSVCSILEHTASDGKNYKTKFYNLDAIIAVGYRVNSLKATRFRQWATNVLKEYMIKGFVLDDERLKKGTRFDKKYFDELLERIRDIRSSERQFYEKVTDLFATSFDYNKNAEITKNFYAKVQNKLHYAVVGLTAPEIIKDRANSDNENMGLTTWGGAPDDKILLSDTKIAKNYLKEEELDELNRIVELYLGFGELQAKRNNLMSMEDWAKQLDSFLEFNGYDILEGKGKISRKEVDKFVKNEFEKFKPIQDELYKSDYNKFEEKNRKLFYIK